MWGRDRIILERRARSKVREPRERVRVPSTCSAATREAGALTNTYDTEFTDADLADLRQARTRLEYPSLTAKIADLVGRPIEKGFRLLPKNWNQKVGEATQAALFKGLVFSIRTMGSPDPRSARNWLHKMVVVGSGMTAGAIGPYSLIVELPFSTCVILRSIADIARSEGHDISLVQVKLACLEVLALGGRSAKDDSAETGYWTVRAALAKAVSEAASHLAQKGLTEKGAPPLARLVAAIASRFGTVVTEEAAAKAIPVVGALSGGAVNYLFMNHFQEMARGHFVVMRLEKKYGQELVEKTYRELVV
jgi:hypothetical protein